MELSDVASEREIDDPKRAHPVYDSMDNVTRAGAILAASRLMACVQAGYHEILKARRILDFGTGMGGSAYPLGLLAKQSGGSVDSLELCTNLSWDEKIKQLGLTWHLPVTVHDVDGLEWIRDRAQEGERYDLIAGCWFAPDNVGERTRGLLSASRQALSASGLLIVFSDLPTMESVRNTCDEESVSYRRIDRLQGPNTAYQADTVVIRQP